MNVTNMQQFQIDPALQDHRRSGGKHTAAHFLLARRRRVASGHDLGAGSEVGAVAGDKEGPEEQERGAKGPRV